MIIADTAPPSADPTKTPYGKVVGVVKDRDQLQTILLALSSLGPQKTEILDGTTGTELLGSEEEDVSRCFLGDTEKEMVHRYLNAVKQGLIVFTVAVDPQHADSIAKTAKALGALDIAYFGNWAITNY